MTREEAIRAMRAGKICQHRQTQYKLNDSAGYCLVWRNKTHTNWQQTPGSSLCGEIFDEGWEIVTSKIKKRAYVLVYGDPQLYCDPQLCFNEADLQRIMEQHADQYYGAFEIFVETEE